MSTGKISATAARPAREQHDPIAESHGLAHVVRHEDHGLVRVPPHRFELVVQAIARHRVERTERFVHQQHFRVLGERAGERDPLAHAAGKLVRPVLGELAEVHHLEQLVGTGAPLVAAHPGELERELDVAPGREPRKQRRFLEHQPGVVGAHVDLARRRLVETGHDVEQRALAAARRAEQAHELARRERRG